MDASTTSRSGLVVALALLALSACGGSSSSPPAVVSETPATVSAVPQAASSDIAVIGTTPGISPFINSVQLQGRSGVSNLAGVEFTIAPKPGSVSKAVDVWYSVQALEARGYLGSISGPSVAGSVSVTTDTINMPVFGLYANYANQVTLRLVFQDGSAQTLPVTITTEPYTDPTGIYSHPIINVARAPGSSLGFDFFAMKSGLGSPVVVDTDAEIRWVIPRKKGSLATALVNDSFVVGDGSKPIVYQLRLDGTITESPIYSADYTDFNHNIDHGKEGLLAELDATVAGVKIVESNVAEIDQSTGYVLNHWDLGAIISAYMTSQGDDPTKFVRPGTDWFHSNASTYDPRDDSVIVSSRENFLIKLDYHTGDIIWIFGDPTKYWYTFPSLRAKALLLTNGGLYPVGQHAVSITSEGYVMVFNDGDGSADNPPGTSPGISRTFSAVSAYAIDAATQTVQDVFDFEHGQTIYSAVCSSAYEANSQSILVDYAVADNLTQSRLLGLDAAHNVVFDFQYVTVPCDTAWNSIPVPFDNMAIDN